MFKRDEARRIAVHIARLSEVTAISVGDAKVERENSARPSEVFTRLEGQPRPRHGRAVARSLNLSEAAMERQFTVESIGALFKRDYPQSPRGGPASSRFRSSDLLGV
jgi:hypothetical protein